jgi:hypothetical protein
VLPPAIGEGLLRAWGELPAFGRAWRRRTKRLKRRRTGASMGTGGKLRAVGWTGHRGRRRREGGGRRRA